MKNPVRDEASAFQVVLLTLGGAVLVVVAAWIETWLGVVVFLALCAAALWAIRGGMRQRPPQAHVVRDASGPTRRILVVANETVGGGELRDLIGRKAEGVAEDVLLVCPALNSKLKTWTSDEDGARAAAQTTTRHEPLPPCPAGRPRARRDRRRRSAAGARGRAARVPGGRDRRLDPPARALALARAGVVENARMRYDVPVTHVVVDLELTDSLRDSV